MTIAPGTAEMTQDSHDFDALLVLSFGGPERTEDVVPFLENVTAGRGIPTERLVEVGEHYFHFGGKSPLNDLNNEIIANLERELAARGHHLPIYFGNRNWHPFGTEAVDELARDGHRRIAVFATSAWGGYSACRQYHEDIVALRNYAAQQGYPEMDFIKLRQFFDHPAFIAEMATALTEALAEIDSDRNTRVLFTAHSVPSAHDQVGGAAGDKHLYSRQVAEASRLVAERVGISDYDLVWQSRSGDPRTPWLEPDIVDHTLAIHESDGITAVAVCPIGFISDHMEVIWDLDSDLMSAAQERGIVVSRARTAGPSDSFAAMVVDLIEELTGTRTPESLGEVTVQGCTRNGQPCAATCCDISSLRHGKTRPANN